MAAPLLGYRPALDGLRAIAVGAVVLHHLNQTPLNGALHLPGLFLGVDLFFVISGFLITKLLIEEHDRAGRVDLRAFWRRRAVRLFPALYVMLATMLVLAAIAPRLTGNQPWTTVWAVFYVSNWQAAHNDWAALAPLAHLWSLAVEEQFYVAWPLIVAAVLRRRRELLGALCVIGALALAGTTAWRFAHGASASPYLYASPESHGFILLLGGAALAAIVGVPAKPRSPLVLMVAGAGGYLLLLVGASEHGPFLYQTGFLPALSVCLLLVYASFGDSVVNRMLAWEPLVHIGRLSYGIYLWHVPVREVMEIALPGAGALRVVRAVVDIVGAVALAQASSMTVERYAKRWRTAKPRPMVSAAN